MSSSNGTTTGTAKSRLKAGHSAVRKAVKARVALSGASGAGKTWTGLSIAEVLVPDGPVLVIDTEPADSAQGAAELYADRFSFDTIRWAPPYDPRDLALTIRDAGSELVPGSRWADHQGGYDLIMVDSASHFWRGEGGTLDIAGGSFGGWREATPIQDDLIQAILRSPAHVICCIRAKQDYQVEQEGGKQKVTKLGLAPVQRDDLEYEFQVVGMMDHTHRLEVTKTRCAALAGQAFIQNDQARFALTLKEWLEGGVELVTQAQVDELVGLFSLWEEEGDRRAVKSAFLEAWGAPVALPAEKWEPALEWVSARLPKATAAEEAPQEAPEAPAPAEAPDGPAEESEATTAISRAQGRGKKQEPEEAPAEPAQEGLGV